MKALLAALLMATLPVGVANATLVTIVTIDFEGFPSILEPGGGDFSAGVEDGVSITATGANPEIFQLFPDPNHFAVSNSTMATTTWAFSLVGGETFGFESFDLRYLVEFGGTTAAASVEGMLSGASQGTDVYFASAFWSTKSAVNLHGVPLDALVITLHSIDTFAAMDNVALIVPEPATFTLLVLGLGLLGVTRPRS